MSTQIAIPDYLRAFMTEQPQALADAEAMAAASISLPRVSLKAKRFRFIEDGEESFNEAESFVVILKVEPGPGKNTKTFYEGDYTPGDTTPPDCASSDGIRPDPWVSKPQNDLCSTCRWNEFGSAKGLGGKKAKKCKDSKRLWVARPDALDGTVYSLGVPVTSLKNLSEFGNKIKEIGIPISACIVKLSTNEQESFPIIQFDVAGVLKEDMGRIALERNMHPNWTGVLKENNPPVIAAKTQSALPNASQGPEASAQMAGQPVRQAIDATVIGRTTEGPKDNDVDSALSKWT